MQTYPDAWWQALERHLGDGGSLPHEHELSRRDMQLARMLLPVLKFHADPLGRIDVDCQTLARIAGVTEDRIRHAIDSLERAGLIAAHGDGTRLARPAWLAA